MEQNGASTFRKMDEASARKIADWRYEPPYDIYNCDSNEVDEHIQEFLC